MCGEGVLKVAGVSRSPLLSGKQGLRSCRIVTGTVSRWPFPVILKWPREMRIERRPIDTEFRPWPQ